MHLGSSIRVPSPLCGEGTTSHRGRRGAPCGRPWRGGTQTSGRPRGPPLREMRTKIRSRGACASELCHAIPKQALPSTSRKGRRSADRRIRPETASNRCGARLCSALAFRRSTAAFEAITPRLGPGPRFLESPDANGRTLSGTSAASTLQSGHAPDGTMPRAARRRSVWPRFRGPPSFHFRKYPRERSLRERDVRPRNRSSDECQ